MALLHDARVCSSAWFDAKCKTMRPKVRERTESVVFLGIAVGLLRSRHQFWKRRLFHTEGYRWRFVWANGLREFCLNWEQHCSQGSENHMSQIHAQFGQGSHGRWREIACLLYSQHWSLRWKLMPQKKGNTPSLRSGTLSIGLWLDAPKLKGEELTIEVHIPSEYLYIVQWWILM